MNDTYFVEIRSSIRRSGPPKLVPLSEVSQYTGFRSIVAYPAALAERITAARSTRNQLDGESVYADTLFVDFDNSPEAAQAFQEFLARNEYAHEIYDSGGRSVHYHIPLVPIFGDWVTDAMREFMKKNGPGCDVSFYHNYGQYRLPRTYHPKSPGRFKQLLASHPGRPLQLTPPAPKSLMPRVSGLTSLEDFYTLLTSSAGPGQRSPRAWLLATMAAEAGLTLDEAVSSVCWWNQRRCDPPQDERKIIDQCVSAYERLARK